MPRVQLARQSGDGVRCDALEVAEGATLADLLEHAVEQGVLSPADRQAVQAGALATAIFGRLRPLGHRLLEGDRIELLGPLTVDPKVARQRRVAHRRAAQDRDKWGGAGR